MPVDLIIRGGTIVRSDRVEQADLFVENGKFVETADYGREEIDATGLHVFPGLIDPHVHFNEPGRTDWEGIETGSSALAAGGGTCYFDMPLNSSPPVLDGEAFDRKLDAARASSRTDFGIWGGLTPVNLDRMDELAARGVVGFKAFMCNSGIDEFPAVDDLTLYRGMRKAKQLGLLVAVHAENQVMTEKLLAETTGHTPRDWAAARPIVAEVEAISRAITFAEETGCALHIVHVSNSRGTELVRRSEGDITCETCPHYLILNINDMERLGAIAKCAPPLRSPGENDEMWQDLVAGKIAFVASDHSPCLPSMKQTPDFFNAWGGIAGVQSTLSILLSRGPSLPLPLVARLTSSAAARRFKIPGKGTIEPGMDADLSLVDVTGCFGLKREHLLDRHKQSPYVGRTFYGIVRQTLVRGTHVYRDGRIVSPPIGQLVKPRIK